MEIGKTIRMYCPPKYLKKLEIEEYDLELQMTYCDIEITGAS